MGDGGPVKFSFFSVVKYRLKSISDIAKTQYILVFFRQPVFNAYPFTHLRSLWLFPYFLAEVQVIIYGIAELFLNIFDFKRMKIYQILDAIQCSMPEFIVFIILYPR